MSTSTANKSASPARAPSNILVHSLDSTSTDTEIQSIMTLSAQIFATQPSDPNRHTSFAYWRERLSNPRSRIIYATHSNSDTPLGFAFVIPRTQPAVGVELLHVWLAGVAEEARGQGILPLLMEWMGGYARGCGYRAMTVATLPETFRKMFRVLSMNGWRVVDEMETAEGRKVVMLLGLEG